MWLVYEKFCITAQENGFYFFEYCMKNKKDNVFFILDKKSPQWDYMQQYRKNIIPALASGLHLWKNRFMSRSSAQA